MGGKFFRFLVAAGLSVPCNIGARLFFSQFMPFALAIVASHLVGMLVAFVLTRLFVFESTRDSRMSELARFAVVNVVSLAQTWVVAIATLDVLIPWLGYAFMPELTAHVIGLASSSVTAFFGHRHYSFRELKATEP